MSEIAALLGKTITGITNESGRKGIVQGDEEILFLCEFGEKYRMLHHSDCCEYVAIEDICGDPEDLIGSPILVAEEASAEDDDTSEDHEPLVKQEIMKGILLDKQIMQEQDDASATWTFYKLDTLKGGVVIRWYGSSNGHYSEEVSFEKVR